MLNTQKVVLMEGGISLLMLLAVLFVVGLGIKFFALGFHDIGMMATLAIAARSDEHNDGRPDLRDLPPRSADPTIDPPLPSRNDGDTQR